MVESINISIDYCPVCQQISSTTVSEDGSEYCINCNAILG